MFTEIQLLDWKIGKSGHTEHLFHVAVTSQSCVEAQTFGEASLVSQVPLQPATWLLHTCRAPPGTAAPVSPGLGEYS